MCYPDMTERTGKNYDVLFERVADILRDTDYLVGNLETSVAGEELGGYTCEWYKFNTPTEYLASLKKCGFHLLSMATNHCLDRGEEGLLRTLDNVRGYGFETVGTYKTLEERDTPFVKELGGIRIAFVNYTCTPF